MNEIEKLEKIIKFQTKYPYYPDAFIKIIANELFEKKIRLESPLMITWDVMNTCNLSCPYCSASSSKYKNKALKIANWNDIIKFIYKCKPIYLTLRGGEPSIHPCFFDILEDLIKWNGFLEIVSNGTGFNDKIINLLELYQQDRLRIKISLDSPEKQINDSNRSVGSYKYAIQAITKISNSKIKNLRVQAVATEKTIPGIYALYQFLHKFNVTSFGVSYKTPTGDSKNQRLKMFNSELLDQILLCIDYFDKKKKIKLEKNHLGYWQNTILGINAVSDLLVNTEKIFHIKCGVGRWKLNIDANGDIYPCDFLKFLEFKLGTIFDSFNSIWNSNLLLGLEKINKIDKFECAKCPILTCSSGCMGLAYERYGNLLRKDPNCGN